jgi:CRISPR-associated protein (TIGR03986 family)
MALRHDVRGLYIKQKGEMMAGAHRIRVRLKDGKKSTWGKIKSQIGTDLDVRDVPETGARGSEFIVCADSQERIERVRTALSAAGLEETVGTTEIEITATSARQRTQARLPAAQPLQPTNALQESCGPGLPKKPYGFVALPATFVTAEPVWHDGTSTAGRLSGEVRLEMENLTPLLVGWERQKIGDQDAAASPWPIPFTRDASGGAVHVSIPNVGRTIESKSVLCPLRAPWGDRPVIISGDSLKGMLRHELGALLGAPMERVAERSYSYRPNSLHPKDPKRRLTPRLARVPVDGIEMRELEAGKRARVPTALELLPANLEYDKNNGLSQECYRFDPANSGGATYRGGLGAGKKLNSKRRLHSRLAALTAKTIERAAVPQIVQEGYLNTLRHLTDLDHGHFSERHPDVPNTVTGNEARQRILEAAANVVFSPGDLVWVEWDTKQKQIVSIGWHYYYRWAYQDTIREKGWTAEREGLFPLADEKGEVPTRLSAVRRLFGYTGDNEGSAGIGEGNYSQLMGRISINAALEEVPNNATDEGRFLPPTFLKELGMPRPSAVEFYLKQPYYPKSRPSDRACLVTYGDAAGYDEPGQLSGRKFYLDRDEAYTATPWKDDSESNRLNDRSTLVLEASKPGRRFRFTLRFRDLDPHELAAALLALCPDQFHKVVGGRHSNGYCSKLGYARPLGWGTVRIQVRELHLLGSTENGPKLDREPDLDGWFRRHFQPTEMLEKWLDVHRHKNPDASDYPSENGQIYTFHARLRAEHTRLRRYERQH